jgi:hypothetical protein
MRTNLKHEFAIIRNNSQFTSTRNAIINIYIYNVAYICVHIYICVCVCVCVCGCFLVLTLTILIIIHFPVFDLKHDVSEIGFCLVFRRNLFIVCLRHGSALLLLICHCHKPIDLMILSVGNT